MPMMRIRIVRVAVHEWFMAVAMTVPRARCNRRIVLMLVMGIAVVNVLVLVFQRFMDMFVLMPLAEVQPDTHGHE